MSYGKSKIGEPWRGYYITAYGIAVKHGFIGTEEEWLESLIGERGESVELRYNETKQELEWKHAESTEWTSLLDISEMQGEVVSQTLETAQNAATTATSAQTAAQAAQAAAEAAETNANASASAATAAKTAAEAAQSGALTAQTAAEAAESNAEKAASDAQGYATNAQGSASAAASSATSATTAKTSAETAAADAVAAKTAAQAAKAAAEAAETNAKASESSAADSAASASQDAKDAASSSSAATAANTSAQAAKTAAEAAKTAAETASISAQGYATNAQGSATAAASSASSASASQSSAEAAADDAISAKTAAEAAKAAAKTSETNAKASESSAADSAASAAQDAKDAAASSTSATAANTAAQAAKTAAETASTSAQGYATDAQGSASAAAASENAAEDYATNAQSWAVGGTGTRQGENTNNAKYWCESAAAAAGGGVTSFNGRAGAVSAQVGDYDAEMVGADAAGTAASAVSAHNAAADAHSGLFAGKADANHNHDGTYQPVGNYLTAETDPTVPAWAKAASKPTYTAAEVGADATGTAAGVQANLTAHENNTVKHITADERTAWNGKAAGDHNHDGTYLTAETDPTVPAWAKAASKPAYTAAEVGADPAGSAAGVQGNLDAHTVDAVKHITANERTAWNGKAAGDHNHDGTYLTAETDPTVPAWAKAASKPAYTAAEVGADAAGSAAGVQNELNQHKTQQGAHMIPCTHSKQGSIHFLNGSYSTSEKCTLTFKAAADFAEGDYFLVDAVNYDAYWIDGSMLSDGAFKIGSVMTVNFDPETSRIYFSGSSGGGGKKYAKFVVGSASAGYTAADVDYLCDGTADEVEINAAITALPSTGGEVVILEGTYDIKSGIYIGKSNVTLRGTGFGTKLIRGFNSGSSTGDGVIYTGPSSSSCLNVKISDLTIDGTSFPDTINKKSVGVRLSASRSLVTNCNFIANSAAGVYVSGEGNIISNNIFYCYVSISEAPQIKYSTMTEAVIGSLIIGNTISTKNYGIAPSSKSDVATIVGNTIIKAAVGIQCGDSTTVSSNFLRECSEGISIIGNKSVIVGNNVVKDSYGSIDTSIAIRNSADYNLVTANMIYGKNYTNNSTGSGNTITNNKYN